MAHLSQGKTSFDSVGSHISVDLGHQAHGAVLGLIGPMTCGGNLARLDYPFQQT